MQELYVCVLVTPLFKKLDKSDSHLCQVVLLLTFMLFHPINPPAKEELLNKFLQAQIISAYYH